RNGVGLIRGFGVRQGNTVAVVGVGVGLGVVGIAAHMGGTRGLCLLFLRVLVTSNVRRILGLRLFALRALTLHAIARGLALCLRRRIRVAIARQRHDLLGVPATADEATTGREPLPPVVTISLDLGAQRVEQLSGLDALTYSLVRKFGCFAERDIDRADLFLVFVLGGTVDCRYVLQSPFCSPCPPADETEARRSCAPSLEHRLQRFLLRLVDHLAALPRHGLDQLPNRFVDAIAKIVWVHRIEFPATISIIW